MPGRAEPVAAIVPHVDAAPRPPRPVQVQPFQDRLALRQAPPATPHVAAVSHAAAPSRATDKAKLAKVSPGPKSLGKVTRTAATAKVKPKTTLHKPPAKAAPHLG